MSAGKGSRPRPFSIPYDEYAKQWDKIFRKNQSTEKNFEIDECKTNQNKKYENHNQNRKIADQ